MNYQESLAGAAAAKFQGSDRPALEAYAEILGVQFHPNISDEKLRARMLENLGEAAPVIEPTPTVPQTNGNELTLEQLYRLDLTPQAAKQSGWQGRRRLISIVRPVAEKTCNWFNFRWGGFPYTVPFNTQVSVPHPIYHNIKQSNHKDLKQRRSVGPDGTQKMHNDYRETNRFNLQDLGDDPKTAHLPVSLKDQCQRIARLENYWADCLVDPEKDSAAAAKGRHRLTVLCRRLRVRYPKGESAWDMRDRILRRLGFDVDMMEEFAA